MKKITIVFILLLSMLSGCSNQVGGNDFFKHIEQLEQSLDASNWNKITNQAEALEEIFVSNKWKIQLLGDEGEYEGLHESINNLIAAAKEKDSTSTRLGLATVKSILGEIYSL
ncbi:DUF4363 family protein [Oceanobacillus sp. J11TS1]|uniref:DUF4363 family protein n=1 Tax=Oceanobacillus sp. J11TS1 TaxID=2807191 RepID=UPI001B20AA1C|nr:DUF4363 family protein [Oceanobacillus sp. J11TS1]GIO24342.1 hypothetical protein J11TS1_29230 [Oceanobacillus sp. J11TS1]